MQKRGRGRPRKRHWHRGRKRQETERQHPDDRPYIDSAHSTADASDAEEDGEEGEDDHEAQERPQRALQSSPEVKGEERQERTGGTDLQAAAQHKAAGLRDVPLSAPEPCSLALPSPFPSPTASEAASGGPLPAGLVPEPLPVGSSLGLRDAAHEEARAAMAAAGDKPAWVRPPVTGTAVGQGPMGDLSLGMMSNEQNLVRESGYSPAPQLGQGPEGWEGAWDQARHRGTEAQGREWGEQRLVVARPPVGTLNALDVAYDALCRGIQELSLDGRIDGTRATFVE